MFGRVSSCAVYAFMAGTGRITSINTPRQLIHSSSALNAIQYLLRYDYVADILERRDPHRPGHLDLAKKFISDGKCVSGGPVGEPGMTVPSGALFIFNDEASAKLFAEEDPYMKAGLVTSHTIEEWNVVVSKE